MENKEFKFFRSKSRCLEITIAYALLVLLVMEGMGSLIFAVLHHLDQVTLLTTLLCFLIPVSTSVFFFFITFVLLVTQYQEFVINKEEIRVSRSLSLSEEVIVKLENIKHIIPTRFLWFYGYDFVVTQFTENGISLSGHHKKLKLMSFCHSEELKQINKVLKDFGYAKNVYLH